MSKRAFTKIIFFGLIALFLIAAPLIVLYSSGWRLDFKNRAVTQTGGLYIKTNQKSAQVYLNDKKIKETGLLLNSAFIENLLPGEYKVRVAKDGFLTWDKNLKVTAQKVTEARHIVLPPKEPKPVTLASGIEQVSWSPDYSKAVFIENEEEVLVLKFYDVSRKLKSHLLSPADLRTKEAQINQATFSPDSQKLLIEAQAKESLTYFVAELNGKPKITALNFLPSNLIALSWHPTNPQFLLLTQETGLDKKSSIILQLVDWRAKTIEPTELASDVAFFTATQSGLWWLDPEGQLWRRSWQDNGPTLLSKKPLDLKTGEIERGLISAQNQVLFLQEQDVFWFNPSQGAFEKISQGSQVVFSSGASKIAVANNHELWVYFFETDSFQPERKASDLIFLTRLSSPIAQVFWLTPYYLGFMSGDLLQISEIDDRDRVQVWPLGQFPKAQLTFNPKTKTLYIFTERKLLALTI